MYQIQITKFEKRSEEELSEMEKERSYRRNDFHPEGPINDDYYYSKFFRKEKILNIEITDEEFQVIKKEVLKTM